LKTVALLAAPAVFGSHLGFSGFQGGLKPAGVTRVFTDMKKWAEIRRLILVEGQSKRSVCRRFGIHWDTLVKILEHVEPPGYRQTKPRPKRKIGPYIGIIEEILREDRNVHRKQRHTKRRIFDRLRDEYGYPGGATAPSPSRS